VLSALGDPRFDPERFYLPADEMLGFVHVPADRGFRIGTRKADLERVAKIIASDIPEHEVNDLTTPTSEFYIARYPVTVAQYRTFTEATGFRIGDAGAFRDPNARPMRYLDWYEALAYCEWLDQMLATAPELEGAEAARLVRAGGWRVSLPSELEWEKAARGGLRGTVFPWGETPDPNHANYGESRVNDTSVAGCFPPNGFGLQDMIGNVFEWTRSRYDPYPYHPGDGREDPHPKYGDWMVVRGGSWRYSLDYARCASRYGLLPDFRLSSLGLRVVLRSPPGS
jgi:formylglycine-generating enzyme required for sulfatase activity